MQHQSIFLVGLMGAGKTTIGRALAKRMGWQFIDSDHEIELRTGVSIPTIFEIEGEDGFRLRERRVIAELTCMPHIVLATGGGAVLSDDSRKCLRNGGFVVYLNATPESLIERLRHDKNRPLLQVADPLARLRELYAARDPLYREVADTVIDVNRLGVVGILKKVQLEMESRCAD